MPRVLLVDDDPTILRLLEVNFRLEGFDTVMVSRGADALAEAARVTPDVIVLDLMLPDIDGGKVLRRLRDEVRCHAPVVFLSARRVDLPPEPGVVSLMKPFDPAILVETVRAAIVEEIG
jgi:two-component system, OmpR family, response regulator